MVQFIYKLDTHPETGDYFIRKFEVVNATPKHVDIAPRDIPNKAMMETHRRISKDTVGKKYFRSAWRAIDNAIEAERKTIRISEVKISRAKEDIERLTSYKHSTR